MLAKIAKQRGLLVVGTLGVLLVAKKKGLVPDVGPIIARMETLGMFVSAQLRDVVLRMAGEIGK